MSSTNALQKGAAAGERSEAPRPLLTIRPRSPWSAADLREIWEYRELLGILAWRDLSVRYKQAVFGVAWAVLQPALQAALFTFVFSGIAGIRTDTSTPYVPFVLAGIAPWALFANGVTQASDSLVKNSALVTKVYFPRVLIPLAAIGVTLVDFVVALLLVLLAMAYYGIAFHLSALLVIPLAAIATLAATGLGLWLSAINAEFRDVRYALPFLIQMLWYVAPVFYPSTSVPAQYRPWLDLNPMTAVIDGFRVALFGGEMPFARLAVSLGASLLLAFTGYLFFRRFERTFVDRM